MIFDKFISIILKFNLKDEIAFSANAFCDRDEISQNVRCLKRGLYILLYTLQYTDWHSANKD